MSIVHASQVKDIIETQLSEMLANQGRSPLQGILNDDCDLLQQGLIDSFGILELMLAIENHFNVEIDYEDLPPEHISLVGPFCEYVSGFISNSR